MASAPLPDGDHSWQPQQYPTAAHSNGYQQVVDLQPSGGDLSVEGVPVPTRLWGSDSSFDYPLSPALDHDVPRGEFKDDLCDCTRNCMPSCWGSICCGGWIVMSQLCDRLGLAPRSHVLAAGLLLTLIGLVVNRLWFSLALCVCTYTSALLIRRAVRKRYAIPGSCACDMLTSVCCASCVVAQAWRHVFPHRKAWHWSKLCDPYAGEQQQQQKRQQQQRQSGAAATQLPTATIV